MKIPGTNAGSGSNSRLGPRFGDRRSRFPLAGLSDFQARTCGAGKRRGIPHWRAVRNDGGEKCERVERFAEGGCGWVVVWGGHSQEWLCYWEEKRRRLEAKGRARRLLCDRRAIDRGAPTRKRQRQGRGRTSTAALGFARGDADSASRAQQAGRSYAEKATANAEVKNAGWQPALRRQNGYVNGGRTELLAVRGKDPSESVRTRLR